MYLFSSRGIFCYYVGLGHVHFQEWPARVFVSASLGFWPAMQMQSCLLMGGEEDPGSIRDAV